MNRRLLWCLWAILPIAVAALHFGPGQRLLARDRASRELSAGFAAMEDENWPEATLRLAAARAMLGEDELEARSQLELVEVLSRIEAGEFIEAATQIDEALRRELSSGARRDAVVRKFRSADGEAGYYAAWVMRLEGASEDEWRAESERARQQFRHLTETASDDSERRIANENLEAVIRLERMDLSELRAMPLPKKCQSCSNCSQKKREQRLSQSPGKKPSDSRKEVNSEAASDALGSGQGS